MSTSTQYRKLFTGTMIEPVFRRNQTDRNMNKSNTESMETLYSKDNQMTMQKTLFQAIICQNTRIGTKIGESKHQGYYAQNNTING